MFCFVTDLIATTTGPKCNSHVMPYERKKIILTIKCTDTDVGSNTLALFRSSWKQSIDLRLGSFTISFCKTNWKECPFGLRLENFTQAEEKEETG